MAWIAKQFFTYLLILPLYLLESVYHTELNVAKIRDEDPVLTKNRIRVSVPQTKRDF